MRGSRVGGWRARVSGVDGGRAGGWSGGTGLAGLEGRSGGRERWRGWRLGVAGARRGLQGPGSGVCGRWGSGWRHGPGPLLSPERGRAGAVRGAEGAALSAVPDPLRARRGGVVVRGSGRSGVWGGGLEWVDGAGGWDGGWGV